MWAPTVSSDELYHYAKGTRAKKHKYIAIKNGRYIYPDDVKKNSNAPIYLDNPFLTYEEAERKRKGTLNSLKSNREDIAKTEAEAEKLSKKAEEYKQKYFDLYNSTYGSPVIAEQEAHKKQIDKVFDTYYDYSSEAALEKNRAEQLKTETKVMLNKQLLQYMEDVKKARINDVRNEQIRKGASKLVSNPIISYKISKFTPKKTYYSKEEFGGSRSYDDWIAINQEELHNSKKKTKTKSKTKAKTTKNGTILRKKKIESGGSGVKKRKRSK